jgi:hypothetical protein
VVSGQADFAKGSPQKPMSFADEVEKFMGCAEYAELPTAKAERIVAQVKEIERVDNLKEALGALFA